MKRPLGNIKYLGDDKYLLRFSAGFDDYGNRLQPSKVVTCKNEREAEAELMKFFAEKDKLLEKKANKAPERLNELYKEWIKNHVSKKAVQTQRFYEGLWENHVEAKSKIKLDAIMPKHIYDILDGVKGDRSKQAVYKMLKTMLNKGKKWGYIKTNPCDNTDAPLYEPEEKRGLTPDEIEKVFTALPGEELKYQAAFIIACMCGLRKQEISALKWDDIDFKNNIIKINKAAIYKIGEGTMESKTKTKKSKRELRLPQEVIPVLKELQTEQKKHRLKIGCKWEGDNWVFTQWNGKIISLHTFTAWWHDFAERLGIEGVTFHGLRHTAASYIIQGGTDVVTASKILGHAKPSTTLNFYGHLVADAKNIALESLERTIRGKGKKDEQKGNAVE